METLNPFILKDTKKLMVLLDEENTVETSSNENKNVNNNDDNLKRFFSQNQVLVFSEIGDFMEQIMLNLRGKSRRKGAEMKIPLSIFKTGSFTSWYSNFLSQEGNKLCDVEVSMYIPIFTSKGKVRSSFVFFWALKVSLFIFSENRIKQNETVFCRNDLSSVVLFQNDFLEGISSEKKMEDTKIVIVKEFRSPVNNEDCRVWDLPGGSSFTDEKIDPLELAVEEVEEEADLKVGKERYVYHGCRQLVSTLSAHKAHLYSVSLTTNEVREMEKKEGQVFGVLEDTERTFIKVVKLSELLGKQLVDWTTMGMILFCLNRAFK